MGVERRIESALKQAVHYRNYRRARERALAKLSHLYPDTYKQLLGIEKAIDEHEGKSWIDINGNTSLDISARTPSRDTTGTQEARAGASNDGGEA
jgi:hypothetical protein